jgi:RNA-binding protein
MNSEQLKKFKKQAHHLKPVILLGEKGLTDTVLNEIEIALESHELIKIKVPSLDQDNFQTTVTEICEKTTAHKVQTVGHTLVLYRKSSKAKKS